MKETKEITLFFAKLAKQSLQSFDDGFQLTDVAAFLDEAMDAPAAFTGLDKCKEEIAVATVGQIHALLDEVKAILDPEFESEVVLEAIISGLKAMFFAIKLSIK